MAYYYKFENDGNPGTIDKLVPEVRKIESEISMEDSFCFITPEESEEFIYFSCANAEMIEPIIEDNKDLISVTKEEYLKEVGLTRKIAGSHKWFDYSRHFLA